MIQDFYLRLYYYLKKESLAYIGAVCLNLLYTTKYFFKKSVRKRKKIIVDKQESLKEIKKVYCNNRVNENFGFQNEAEMDLSIIVPVYNGEKYVEENIQSCLSQDTNYKYEIIYVNDGSKDGTKSILEKYKNDKKIKVLHKENGGSASARNMGIEISKGKYLMFVDCDDLIHCDMVEKMLKNAYINDSDIVMCSHNLIKYYNGEEKAVIPYIYPQRNLLHYNKDSKIFNYSGFPWGKVYKRKLFQNARFPEGYWYEDTIIHMLVYIQCNKFNYIDDVLYDYRFNENSITNTVSNSINPKVIDRYWIIRNIENQYRNLKIDCDEKFYVLLLKHLSAYYYKDIKLLDEVVVTHLFVLAKDLLHQYKPCKKIKLSYMLKQVEKSFEKNDIELWKLASSYQ